MSQPNIPSTPHGNVPTQRKKLGEKWEKQDIKEWKCNIICDNLSKVPEKNKKALLAIGGLVIVIVLVLFCIFGTAYSGKFVADSQQQSQQVKSACCKGTGANVGGNSNPQFTTLGKYVSEIHIPLFAGLVTAIIIALVSWELNNQNRATRKQNEIASENNRRTLSAKIFNDAVRNLGSKEHAKVLGAVYALNDLARTYPTYRRDGNEKKYDPYGYSQTVLETLCGFIRVETYTDMYSWNLLEERRNVSSVDTPISCPHPPGNCRKSPLLFSCDPTRCPSDSRVNTTSLIVIQTIINRLFIHPDDTELYMGYKKDKFKVSLRGADLQGVDFFPVGLSDTGRATIDWTNADLRHINLTGAGFKNTKLLLKDAELRGANLSGADLSENDKPEKKAKATPGADLSGANLKWVDMRGACLRGCTFSKTTIVKHLDMRGVHVTEKRGFLGACYEHIRKEVKGFNEDTDKIIAKITSNAECIPCVFGLTQNGEQLTFKEVQYDPDETQLTVDKQTLALSDVQFSFEKDDQKEFWKKINLEDVDSGDCEKKCKWFIQEGAKFGSLSFSEVTELAQFALSEEEFRRVFGVPKDLVKGKLKKS